MEIAGLVISLFAILIGGFIAYHIYFLQKRLTTQQRLQHARRIRDITLERLGEINREGLNRETMLVNTRRYPHDYEYEIPEKNKHGYVELRVELKSVRYDGVEFFIDMPQQAYYDADDSLTLTETKKEAFTVFPVGIVPYDWIVDVDLRGDEYKYVPIYFVKFIGAGKYPYSRTCYYKISETYDDSQPFEMKYQLAEIKNKK